MLALQEEKLRRLERRRFQTLYPDTGPLRRDLYSKHLEFFRAGADYNERCAMAANRIGKSFGMGGYEMVCHLTGQYPEWWEGRRFDHPIDAWAAGKTKETTRDIIQLILFGPVLDIRPKTVKGTGLIPGEAIKRVTWKDMDAIDTAEIKHVSGGTSVIGFKSYDQGAGAFEGTAKHVVWFDEEPPMGVYNEGLIRTMTTNGIAMLTFTPLQGLSEVVRGFLGAEFQFTDDLETVQSEGKFLVQAGWDDVPHLDEDQKRKLLASTPPYLRDARSKGAPSLGAGAIYPVEESAFVVDPFPVPKYWRRAYAMDVGWRRTAVVWLAYDPENDTVYLTAEYYRGQAEPSIHATAVKARGAWIPGVIDPAARGRSQADGKVLKQTYTDLGLDLVDANNAVEAGVLTVFELLSTGRLKVFKTMQNWLAEYRLYRRDEKGQIIKEKDHLMDATRYAVTRSETEGRMSALQRAIVKPAPVVSGLSQGVADRVAGY